MTTEIYPVVHINNIHRAVEQTGVALELGANGVYLIDHEKPTTDRLFDAFNLSRSEYPGAYIGMNILCLRGAYRAFEAIHRAKDSESMDEYPDGLWVDDARIDAVEARELREAHPELGTVRYLGGVAFKYSPYYTDDPGRAAGEFMKLKSYVDVVTTSGPGTGVPPSPEKIRAMHEVAEGQPLAVASGVSADNLEDYSGAIDQLLVATSIESSPDSGVFDRSRLEDLIEVAREL